MTGGTKGFAQRASSLRPRCVGEVDPGTVTHIIIIIIIIIFINCNWVVTRWLYLYIYYTHTKEELQF
jgi:hypothetical protein